MPNIGYRQWILGSPATPPTQQDSQLIHDYLAKRGHSHIVARHDDHIHVIGFESSGSYGFARWVHKCGRFNQWSVSSRKLSCFDCQIIYLSQQRRTMDYVHQDGDCPPRCERSIHVYPGSDDQEQDGGDQDCSAGDPSDSAADFDSEEEAPFRKRAKMGVQRAYSQKNTAAVTERVSQTIQKILPQSLNDLSEFFANNGELSLVSHKDYSRICQAMLDATKAAFRKKPWLEIMKSIPIGYFAEESCLDVDASLVWFDKIMEFNKIDPSTFVNDCFKVMEKILPKKNSIIILGPPNSGKTLVMSSLCKSAIFFSSCQNFTGNSSFEFQEMISSRCALINEPMITDKTIETMKNVLEGNPTNVDKKYHSAQLLPRTPCFITTNASLCYYTSNRAINKEAIIARCFSYNFNTFPELKDCEAQLHPLMWLSLYDKYIEQFIE